ncbi:MAG: 2-keto-4-pentenoate hydratase [Burkholderiales bacterium]
MDKDRYQRAARYLLEQHQAGAAFDALPGGIAPQSVEDAYGIQEEFRAMRAARLGPVAGHKVALTSHVMQEMLKFYSPFAGSIHANIVHRTGTKLDYANYIHLGIECELAATLGRDLPASGVPYTREQIAQAVETLAPAFELVDDRHADYKKIASLIFTLIADNAWNGGIVLGPATKKWRDLDLESIRGVVQINGAVAGEGHGRDVLGHPFDALTWCLNTRLRQGHEVRAGMIVMTGSMIATKFVRPGDTLRFAVEGLGEVSVSC